ncbi:hypothetical protein MAR_028751 [Mya arenaria]|uniref:Uncharacterized protein n=1 Tax=Mya arenaria TaxID=6604 RepID=A0ABY7DEH1_MYAAR|nr:hypothetical protein MAR_028706 [Mya arenaria]WAQ96061.1 hypothetical protein MAR_028751 [Mya arenaria]
MAYLNNGRHRHATLSNIDDCPTSIEFNSVRDAFTQLHESLHPSVPDQELHANVYSKVYSDFIGRNKFLVADIQPDSQCHFVFAAQDQLSLLCEA